MFKLAPSFEKAIRRLKSPTSIDYDAAAWRAALAGAKDAGPVERRLVATGEWIAAHASLGRSTLKTPELDQLDGEWRTVLAIAILNREYRAADAMVREQLKAAADEGRTAILDEMGAMRVMGGAGQPLAVADLNEASVEAVESWLYDALNAPGSGTASGDLTTAAVRGIQAYGWRKALNSLWNEARYLGAYVYTYEERMYWLPADADLEKLISACRERQEMNLLGFPTIDRRQWPLIPKARRKQLGMVRSVTSASRKDGVAALKVEALQYLSSRPPEYVGEKGSLEGSHLAEFLTLAMPTYPRLSPLLVLQAWHVVRDAAEALTRVTPQPVRLDVTTALESALVVSRPTLTGAIARALAVDATVAETLVEFLTYRLSTGGSKGQKGLWAAPLVPVPGTDLFALPLNPLVTSNPLRRLEAWLERGGIDDSNPVDQRGERYEASYRRSLCAAVDGNSAFQTARCAQDGVRRNVLFDEQVDLLVSIGDLALVGELKFFLTPADPHERARYFDKLGGAGEQAVRKAAALDARRDVVAAALGIPEEQARQLTLKPIVVTNQGFAFSLEVGGATVIDAGFLRTYLGDGEMISGMATSGRTNAAAQSRHRFYSTEMAARRQFDAEMAAPYVLTKFLDRMRLRTSTMPMLTGPALEIVAPYAGPLEGYERDRMDALIASLKP